MAKMPKYDLNKRDDGKWALEPEGGGRAKKLFDRKSDAIAGGVLGNALGPSGGSVRIRKENGQYQEERTFPRSKDPKSSPG
ncbi:DUF2188 domain-containing protein [Aurantiacibacter xanthus]|uniref:DUF2188 domain-containing protein n=1 Tax=Aurantiacibacter xanthus TaxID=1784712 RepID=A0A3A1P3I0_9SPHN|nr:DUF2188 domain-containing protein [Aurantiacibacter xanthus]RIV80505.1 DUF2188 domain-containing protein [Aurantiacibacter xanthus]